MTWTTTNPDDYITDESLLNAIIEFLYVRNAKYVADFGCGKGYYVEELRKCGIFCFGFDSNPNLSLFDCEHCMELDLSVKQELLTFDWVISLDVGEHIEKEFEWTFIHNIHCANKHGVIISWAIPGQTGIGHVNEQPNSYIIREFRRKGYKYLKKESMKLRQAATLPWFKKTIMVFEKKK